MKTKVTELLHSDHNVMIVEMFREDPEFAAEYLNGVLEDGDQKELMLAMRRIAEAFGQTEICGGDSRSNLVSRDTETRLSENLGSRLYLMELALAATQAKCQALAAKHKIDGAIKSIFVAPEYLFSAPRDDPGAGRAVSHITRSALKSLLAEKSRKFQDMLIVPGTIIFKVALAEYPILGEAKKVRALKILEVAQAKPKEFPVAEIRGGLVDGRKEPGF